LYLDIESTRFDGKFRYLIEVDTLVDPASLVIPPMLLQPFAENAIWHGLMPSYQIDKWLSIRILPSKQGQIQFDIEDNGIGREKAQQNRSINRQKSLGLDITQQRVALFNQHYPSRISIQIVDIKADSRTGTLVRITYQPDELRSTVVS
jgi:sensor histidine kinase YesM